MNYRIQTSYLYKLTPSNDWQQIEFYPTDNKGSQIDPKFLVIHYTAGSLDARGTAQYFQKPEAKTSAHLILDKDGTMVQCVEFHRKAWHAGKSHWAGYDNLNNYSIGIEVVNPGPLTKNVSGQYKTWWGATVDDSNIIESTHPNDPNGPIYGWVPFTPQQVSTLISVGQSLMREYGLQEGVGHDMIAPGRKTDPGPCMDHRVYDQINSVRADSVNDWEWFVEKVDDYLNGRSGPGTNYEVVAHLPKNSILEVLNRQGVWWFVENSQGLQLWVHSKFLGMRKVNHA
jgi:N-acetylmuramoyl-L-alanine amidase